MENYKINIVHLYPKLLNLYGDKGNISCLCKRLMWRGIEAEVKTYSENDGKIDFENADIILLGGGNDREMEIVRTLLLEQKEELSEYVEKGKTLLAFCGGFEVLGKFLYLGGEKTEGLGILDMYTEYSDNKKRFTGDVLMECSGISEKIVGFENHISRIQIGKHAPLGRIICGNGNNGEDKTEGVIYKNLVGTSLHGPLFPKNPKLCDRILLNCLKQKYGNFEELQPIDDGLEILANEYMANVLTGTR